MAKTQAQNVSLACILNLAPLTLRPWPYTFGIFDAFPDEAGREAHLSGKVAAALMAQADELFSEPPSIEKVDVLASKLPG